MSSGDNSITSTSSDQAEYVRRIENQIRRTRDAMIDAGMMPVSDDKTQEIINSELRQRELKRRVVASTPSQNQRS